jgi:hypothetical protein
MKGLVKKVPSSMSEFLCDGLDIDEEAKVAQAQFEAENPSVKTDDDETAEACEATSKKEA